MILVAVVSGFFEVVSTFLRGHGVKDFSDGVADGIEGSPGGFAQEVLELGEEHLDGVEIR